MLTKLLSPLVFACGVAAVFGILLAGSPAQAQTTYYWDTTAGAMTGGAGTWDPATTPSWSLSTTGDNPLNTWTAGSNAEFLTGSGAVAVNGNPSVNNITFDAGTGYTLAGPGALTLGGGTITANGNASIGCAIGGSAGLVKAGSAALTLSGNNTYSGLTTVAAGTLDEQIANGGAYLNASGASIAPGAALQFDVSGGIAPAANLAISGSGTLLKTSPGVMYLTNGPSIAVTMSMGAGGLIDIENGAIANDWSNVAWSNNLASMKIAAGAIFDIRRPGRDHRRLDRVGHDLQFLSRRTYEHTDRGGRQRVGHVLWNNHGHGHWAQWKCGRRERLRPHLRDEDGHGHPGPCGQQRVCGRHDHQRRHAPVRRRHGQQRPRRQRLHRQQQRPRLCQPRGEDLCGGIYGSGTLVKTGSGALTLSGGVACSGPTIVSAGTLDEQLANGSSFLGAGGASIAPGATLQFDNSGNIYAAASCTISGSGTLLKTGAGVMSLAGYGCFAGISMAAGGLIDIEGGAITNDDNNVPWASNLASMKIAAGAIFDIRAQSVTIDALSGSGTVSDSYNNGYPNILTIGAANGSGTFYGTILGSGGATGNAGSATDSGPVFVTKIGTGIEVLAGNNTYTGTTTVSAGTLSIIGSLANTPVVVNGGLMSVAGTLGSASVTVNGGTLQVGDGTVNNGTVAASSIADNSVLVFANPAAQTYAGAISGSGSFVKTGPGALTLTGGVSCDGLTTISAGTLVAENTMLFSNTGGVSIAPGATLQFDNSSHIYPLAALTISGSGTLLKTGPGVMSLAYPFITMSMGAGGLIDIEGGAIANDDNNVVWSNNLASMNIAPGAIFDIRAENATIDALSGSGTVVDTYPSGGNTLTLGAANGSGTFYGNILGTLDWNWNSSAGTGDPNAGQICVTKIGTGIQVLAGSNIYSGATTISGGTLQIGNGTSGEFLASPSITLSNNAVVAFNHADGLSYSGVISGSGQLIKLGTGNLDLVGSGTYSGPTTISAGTLELDGNGNNLPAATALTIASSGVLDMAGNPLTVGSLSGSAGAIVTNSLSSSYLSTLTVAPSSGSTTFAGSIVGSNALALSGSGELTLSGTNAYTGGTTVSGGTLDIAAPSALAGSGFVTIAAGGRLVLGSGAGIGALLAASPPVGSGAVALSAAASAPATIGGYENTSGSMATLGGAPPLSQGGGGSAVGGAAAAAVPEPAALALLAAGTIILAIGGWRKRR